MLSHGNLTSAVSVYDVWGKSARLERNAIERVICVLPLFHIYALTVVLLSSIRRGNLISLHQRFDVDAVMRDIEVKRATAFPGVPTMWIAIAALPDLDKRDLSSLVSVGSGGAPLPVEVARILERRVGMKLKSGWGMTETCSPGTAHPKEGPDKPGSIGLMLPGIEMDVVRWKIPTTLMPVGEVGEIRIRGPNVTKGYWSRPKETAEAFVGDRFLTGDIGYMDADGYFYLVDRKKDMIISGGFNVYPQMIEQAIYTHPSVQEVIVIGIPDDYRGEAAKAFIKLRDGANSFSLEELRAFLTGKLGKHEIPAALDFVDELPRTPVGKLSRHELRTAAARTATTSQEAVQASHRPREPGLIRLRGWGRLCNVNDGGYGSLRSQGRRVRVRVIEHSFAHRRIRWISLSARKKWRFVRRCGPSSRTTCRRKRGARWSRAVTFPRMKWSPGGAS